MTPILIIDDDADIRSTLHALLEDEGYPVYEAANGLEGLAFLQAYTEQGIVVVLDFMMPKLDGTGVLRSVRDSPNLQTHRFVLITAAGLAIPAELGALLQTFDIPVVRKPFDFKDIREKIEIAAKRIPSPENPIGPNDSIAPSL